jgi:hypothetical protein
MTPRKTLTRIVVPLEGCSCPAAWRSWIECSFRMAPGGNSEFALWETKVVTNRMSLIIRFVTTIHQKLKGRA